MLVAPPASAATRTVPQGFVGTTWSGPMLDPAFDARAETGLMRRSGVESVRVPFYWSAAQPDSADQPPDFTHSDRVVALAAERGFSILPAVLQSPRWARKDPDLLWSPPADPADYARYLSALVARYGPAGTFWRDRPDVPRDPIRQWQIWNEPGQKYFWAPAPDPAGYVALLRAARLAIKAADPRATVVLAGLNEFAWRAIARIYRAGGRGLFDVAAVHPFTLEVGNMMRIVELVRRTMARYGDAATPLVVSEFSWPTAPRRNFGFEVSEAQQARNVGAALRRFAENRRRLRIRAVFWETWIGADRDPDASFDWAGLRALTAGGGVRSKPALAAFAARALRLKGLPA